MPARPRSLAFVLSAAAIVTTACRNDSAQGDGSGTGTTGASADTTATAASASSGATAAESGDPGAPPPTPTLAMPADGATEIPIAGTQLCWNLV